MLLFIAFLCFAVLMVSWLMMPENAQEPAVKPAESLSPETSVAPARA